MPRVAFGSFTMPRVAFGSFTMPRVAFGSVIVLFDAGCSQRHVVGHVEDGSSRFRHFTKRILQPFFQVESVGDHERCFREFLDVACRRLEVVRIQTIRYENLHIGHTTDEVGNQTPERAVGHDHCPLRGRRRRQLADHRLRRLLGPTGTGHTKEGDAHQTAHCKTTLKSHADTLSRMRIVLNLDARRSSLEPQDQVATPCARCPLRIP